MLEARHGRGTVELPFIGNRNELGCIHVDVLSLSLKLFLIICVEPVEGSLRIKFGSERSL